MNYEIVMGLEVHVELATKSKIFCGCSTEFGGEPNTHVCPVCSGMPGVLPVMNKKVVEYAVKAGLALNCDITRKNRFDRKNYFYPDLPKAYQVSQLYFPICQNGKVEIDVDGVKKNIGIHEIHMEEDAGKLVHDPWDDCTLVDYNRCGVPLLEIVSEPDFRSAEEVLAYLNKLRDILMFLGVSDCKMQEGSMRADVNLSIRPVGQEEFGTRTEMKNMNSFKAIQRAIKYEAERQMDILDAGKEVMQETRRWDDNTDYDASILTSAREISRLFEDATELCGEPKEVSNLIMGELMRLMSETSTLAEDLTMEPKKIADLIGLIKGNKINRSVAKEVFEEMFKNNVEPVNQRVLKTLRVVRLKLRASLLVRQ